MKVGLWQFLSLWFAIIVAISSSVELSRANPKEDTICLETEAVRYLSLTPDELRAEIAAGLNPFTLCMDRESPISLAVSGIFDSGMLEVLLEAGVPSNSAGPSGGTALMYLLAQGTRDPDSDRAYIKKLLDHGARIDVTGHWDLDAIEAKDAHFRFPYIGATLNSPYPGTHDRILLAIEMGARFGKRTEPLFATPLYYAIKSEDPALVNAFLEAGAERCLFPEEAADFPHMDGDTYRERWEQDWNDPIEPLLDEVLAGYPEIAVNLRANDGLCRAEAR